MSYIQIKDILHRAVEFHKMLIDFYSTVEGTAKKDSVKLLTNYMARHEGILKEQLSQLTEKQEKEIAEEWIKYEPEVATCRCFEDLKITKHSNVDDIVDAGLKLNQCLVDLYHNMAETAHTEKIKTLFSNLELMEIAEKKKLARVRGM